MSAATDTRSKFSRFSVWWVSEGWATWLGAFPLLWVAFYNGFPLLDYDSGTYIGSGFTFSFPLDRPIFYGLFTLVTSLGLTLWGTLFAQAWLTSTAIFKLRGLVLGLTQVTEGSRSASSFQHLGLVALLTVFTSISWYVSAVMADVFTPLMILGAVGLVMSSSKREKWFWRWLTFGSALMHGSHYLILGLLFVLLFLVELGAARLKPTSIKSLKVWRLAIPLFAAIALLSAANLKNGAFTPSPASHVFLLGRLTETGLLKQHLAKACLKESNNSGPLCDNLDKFPTTLSDFIWSAEMPHAKEGWLGVKDYYQAVGKQVLKEEPLSFLMAGVIDIGHHLTHLSAVAVTMPLEHPASIAIKNNFSSDYETFVNSRQQQGQLQGRAWDQTYLLSYTVSTLLLFVAFGYFFLQRKVSIRMIFLGGVGVVLLGFLANLTVVGVLIGNDTRLGCRTHWLVVMMALIAITAISKTWRQNSSPIGSD